MRLPIGSRCSPRSLARVVVSAAAFAGMVTTGCATDSSTGAEPSPSPTSEPAAEPEPSPAVDAGPAERVSLTLSAADDVNVDAFALDAAPNAPGILLLHQFQQSHAQWGDFPETLNAQGYFVVAISYRGHGNSDAYPQPIANLLTDPLGAPLDVDAGLSELIDRGADPDRLGVIGTSIGANLTVAVSILDDAKTFVSLSSRIPPVESLAQQTAEGMRSVFYISSANDGGGQADDATTMHGRTADPKDLLITDGSAHGIAILDGTPEVEGRILTWLSDTL